MKEGVSDGEHIVPEFHACLHRCRCMKEGDSDSEDIPEFHVCSSSIIVGRRKFWRQYCP